FRQFRAQALASGLATFGESCSTRYLAKALLSIDTKNFAFCFFFPEKPVLPGLDSKRFALCRIASCQAPLPANLRLALLRVQFLLIQISEDFAPCSTIGRQT
ncbi:hypothetical protein, partial [Stappia sp. BW2]|uniref:hypothetical protein n=1 Tax=Stappia sp. BW2 TaxID=2592622 RepID=UPI00196756F7